MGCYVSVFVPPTSEGGTWERLEGPNTEIKWSGYETTILSDAGIQGPKDGSFEWDGSNVEAAQVVGHLVKERNVFRNQLDENPHDEGWGEIWQIEQKLDAWLSLFRDLLLLRARGIQCICSVLN